LIFVFIIEYSNLPNRKGLLKNIIIKKIGFNLIVGAIMKELFKTNRF